MWCTRLPCRLSYQHEASLYVRRIPWYRGGDAFIKPAATAAPAPAPFSSVGPVRRNHHHHHHGPFTSVYGSAEFLGRRHRIRPEQHDARGGGGGGGGGPGPERARLMWRSKIAGIGIVVSALCMLGIVKSGAIPEPSKDKATTTTTTTTPRRREAAAGARLDGPPSITVDRETGAETETSLQHRAEQIPTGTSTIPTFPKTIQLSSLNAPGGAFSVGKGQEEYQLVGLGIRTVSFLGIQVYVVGLYIAVSDIATLQDRLVREMDPLATTLVPGERDKLKELLMDPIKGEEVWDKILKDGGTRTAFRIVPTRNTDFMHLRDGWVRGITARTQARIATGDQSFNDETFGASLNQFKAIWGSGARKSVPKGETLLLTRDAQGKMAAWYEEKQGSLRLGEVDDERISRLIWLGYLAGKNVSSEGARRSVVDGVMEFVGRPVGTVAQQVV